MAGGKDAKSPGKTQSGKTQVSSYNISRKAVDYTSDGVRDHDIFKLPGSDWQLLGVLTLVAAAVRLFRISQPTSVVFDEVQYAAPGTLSR